MPQTYCCINVLLHARQKITAPAGFSVTSARGISYSIGFPISDLSFLEKFAEASKMPVMRFEISDASADEFSFYQSTPVVM